MMFLQFASKKDHAQAFAQIAPSAKMHTVQVAGLKGFSSSALIWRMQLCIPLINRLPESCASA